MPRDQRLDDEPRSLDIFDDLGTDKADRPDVRSDPMPAGLAEAEPRRTGDTQDGTEETRTTAAGASDLPDAAVKEADGDENAGDLLEDSDNLNLSDLDELQASEPDPTLNLPDDADEDDDLAYGGPAETLTFSDTGNVGGELEYSGPEPRLNLSEADGDDNGAGEEPAASVPEGESVEPIIFDPESSQSYPVENDDDDQPEDDDPLGLDPLTPPEPGSDGYADFTQMPDLPQISAFPEPPYELEYDPNPPYQITIDDSDDADDDMGEG